MIDMSDVNSTRGIGYLTLIISFQLLTYKERYEGLSDFCPYLISLYQVMGQSVEILLCSTFYVLQVSGKHNFIVSDTPWKLKE